MRRYSTDPNSPDNPHGLYFEPDHVYEIHITHGGGPVYKPTQTQAEWVASPQPGMGYAEADVTVVLLETPVPKTAIPGMIEKATLKLTFTGKARSKELMGRSFFNTNGKYKKFSFKSDIEKWLSKCFVTTSPISPDGLVTAILTIPESSNIPSTSTTVSGRHLSTSPLNDDGNGVSSGVSSNFDSDGNMTASATSSIAGNTSSVSLSSDEPFTVVFSFEPQAVKGEYNGTMGTGTDFEGTLEVELTVTYNPKALPSAKQADLSAVAAPAASAGHASFSANKIEATGLVIAAGITSTLTVIFRDVIASAAYRIFSVTVEDITFILATAL